MTAQISGNATGTLSNTATVAPPAGVTDPTPANNTATDGPDNINPTADLAITKTGPSSANPGGPMTYVITVTNNGPGAVTGAGVSDTFSNQLTNIAWTCTPSSGASCAAANGTGNISTTVNLPNGGSAVFAVSATISPNATGTISNVAAVSSPAGVTDSNANNNVNAPVVTVVGPGPDLGIAKSHTGNFQVGQFGFYKLTVENVGQAATTGPITVVDSLPNGLVYNAATGQGWTCSAVGQKVTCVRNAAMVVGAISEITLKVFVTDKAYPSVVNQASVSTPGDEAVAPLRDGDRNEGVDSADATSGNGNNNAATDATIVENGQGVLGAPYPATSPISDQKAGSVLVFPVYTSEATGGGTQNTRISLTNTDPTRPVSVHLFFVDGSSCSISDSYICLTAQQTTSFLVSDIDPGVTGYLVAVAVNNEGCPIYFNQLIGDEFVKFSSGHQANLGAEAISALPGLLNLTCSLGAGSVPLNFDGVMYNQLPRVLSLDNLPSRADGNDTMLIVNRVGGNLATGCATLGTLFGLLYNDTEIGISFQLNAGSGQYRASITNNAPRTAPRFEQFIPAGRSGWLKLYSQSSGVGLLGASINRNPNATTQTTAFNQGHNLHKLTLESSVTVTIPIFPPNCQ